MATAMRFDPIGYARQLRHVGVSQEQADIQAHTIDLVINDIVRNQDLATKNDLAGLKFELIKWILGNGVGTILALIGIIKFIH